MSAIASSPQAVFKSEKIILRSADAAEWLQCASRLDLDMPTVLEAYSLDRHIWPARPKRALRVGVENRFFV
jgi:hypothetical protein